ncbi:hypothetical protein E4U11_002630 [Claviceps purpurea]|nr:hypothetical protein E4U11_002630 [Claviceps purpurea]
MDEFPSDVLPTEAIYSTKEALREAIILGHAIEAMPLLSAVQSSSAQACRLYDLALPMLVIEGASHHLHIECGKCHPVAAVATFRSMSRSFLMGMAVLFATDLIRPLLFIIMLPAFARQLIRLIDSFDLKTKLQS